MRRALAGGLPRRGGSWARNIRGRVLHAVFCGGPLDAAEYLWRAFYRLGGGPWTVELGAHVMRRGHGECGIVRAIGWETGGSRFVVSVELCRMLSPMQHAGVRPHIGRLSSREPNLQNTAPPPDVQRRLCRYLSDALQVAAKPPAARG